MRGRVIRINQELSDADLEAWSELAARAAEPNAFHEPACVLASTRNLAHGNDRKLVVAEQDGRFLACLPLQHVRTQLRGLRQPSYQSASSRVRRMNYLGTPLVDASAGSAAMVTLLETVAAECRSEGSLTAEFWDVTAGGTVDSLLREAAAELELKLELLETFDRGILRREEIIEGEPLHSTRTLRNLRSKQRALGRALDGEVSFVDRSDDAAIAEYIRIEASGYKAQTGIAMTGVAGEPEYFTEMCRSFAAQGRLHLQSLMVGSATIATVAWIRARHEVFQFKWSYDAEYAKYSPGLQLHMASIGNFQSDLSALVLDTCTADNNRFVTELYRSRRTLNRYRMVVDEDLPSRAIVGAIDGSHRLMTAGRKLRGTLEARAGKQRDSQPPPTGFRTAGS